MRERERERERERKRDKDREIHPSEAGVGQVSVLRVLGHRLCLSALISKWRAGNQRRGMISFMVWMGNGNSSSFFTSEYFCFFGFHLKTKPLICKTQADFFSLNIPSFILVYSLSGVWLFVTSWTAALPRPSLSPRVCSNSCALSWWCHPTISSSAAPFSFCPQFHTYHSELPLLKVTYYLDEGAA